MLQRLPVALEHIKADNISESLLNVIRQIVYCNWIRTHNHLVHKRTLNHLAKLAIIHHLLFVSFKRNYQKSI